MKNRSLLFYLLIALLASLLAARLFRRASGPEGRDAARFGKAGEEQYRLGEVLVDLESGEAVFPAEVRANADEVRFLANLRGYLWLDEESALVSPARLLDLQQALALLDWEFWEEYRLSLLEGRPVPDGGFTLRLSWEENGEIRDEAVGWSGRENPAELIFLGSPYFDEFVLGASPADCRACPLFPLEKEAIDRLQSRSGLASSFTVPEGALPPPGTAVTVTILGR